MSLYDLEAQTIDGPICKLAEFRGKILLIVNVASRCACTRQYAGLQRLYETYKDKGFAILGFPCNQFGHQEPGDEATIKSFCSLRYRVTFPMFAKVEVNGKAAHPVYKLLKDKKRGTFGSRSIKWNFTKFLIDREGNIIKRYGPIASARRIEKDIAALIS